STRTSVRWRSRRNGEATDLTRPRCRYSIRPAARVTRCCLACENIALGSAGDRLEARLGDIYRPVRRELGVLFEPMDDELLVYDSERSRAHSLNSTAALVWRACDGRRDVNGLAGECGVDVETVLLA